MHVSYMHKRKIDLFIFAWKKIGFAYIQKSSVTELEIQIVWHQSTVSYLQVIVVISDRRDTYTHTLYELLLTVEYFAIGHVQ